MSSDKIVLITGATGQQGGAIARELLKKGWKVRAMTRKPEGDAAKALKALGATVIQGDLEDANSLAEACKGAWGVFAVQNTWEAGVAKEEEQGHRVAKVAREAGVQHFVYSSVGSAHRDTGIPHFDNKWRVEQTVRSLGFPSHVIVRPVFFMENLVSAWFLNDNKLATAMKPDTKLQMIAVEDIGKVGALAFENAAELDRAEIDIAGDAVSMSEVVAVLSEAMGTEIEFVQLPIEVIRGNSEDFALMLEWFEKVGYDADIEGVQKKHGLTFSRLTDWARKHVKRA